MKITKIITDDTMRELTPHGSQSFPCEYYEDKLDEFDIGRIDWHWHKEIELVIVERGIVCCRIGNARVELCPGEGLFINAKAVHSFESAGDGYLRDILFDPTFIAAESSGVYEEAISPLINSDCSHMVLKAEVPWQREFLHCLRDSFALFQNSGMTRRLQLHICICNMWLLLVQHKQEFPVLDGSGKSKLLQARLRRMILFVEQHYGEVITLEDIALSANISKSEALRCFQTGMQESPVHFLSQYRLRMSREKLAATADRISDISEQCGFESAAYFCRMFKRSFGMSPGEYRKQSSSTAESVKTE